MPCPYQIPFPLPPSLFPYDEVGISDDRLRKNGALPVPRAHRPGADRGLEIIDEPLHDATLHEARSTRRYAFVIHGPRRGTAGSERVVRERERWIEHLFADLRGEGRDALQHGLAREGLGEGQ